MIGKFNGVTIEKFKIPKVLIFDNENELLGYISRHNYEAITPEVTGKNIYDVFEELEVPRDKVIEFQKGLKQETVNVDGFRRGFILSYKDVSRFVPLDQNFKDIAYERFYVNCIQKYFI